LTMQLSRQLIIVSICDYVLIALVKISDLSDTSSMAPFDSRLSPVDCPEILEVNCDSSIVFRQRPETKSARTQCRS
jgi:hypothetical protein